MSNKCCSGNGEGRKDTGGGGGSRSKTSCMWRVVCDKVACERWCCKERWWAKTNKTQPRPFARSKWKTSLCDAIGSTTISARKCHTRMSQALPSPQCHQKSSHDKRHETSHVASAHALIGCKQHYLQTEKTWQHSTAEATAHSLLAKIFFSRQQMVLHAYSKICTVQAKTYQAETYLALKESQWRSCEQRRFHRVWHPTGAWQQCERHAKKAVYQNMDKTSNNSDSKESGLPKT